MTEPDFTIEQIKEQLEIRWPGITIFEPKSDCAHGPDCKAHQMHVISEHFGPGSGFAWRHWLI